jgi:hypothetical protein
MKTFSRQDLLDFGVAPKLANKLQALICMSCSYESKTVVKEYYRNGKSIKGLFQIYVVNQEELLEVIHKRLQTNNRKVKKENWEIVLKAIEFKNSFEI